MQQSPQISFKESIQSPQISFSPYQSGTGTYSKLAINKELGGSEGHVFAKLVAIEPDFTGVVVAFLSQQW